MGKIKSSLGKKEILLFAVKCIVLNAAFICAFSALSAFLIYKFDIDLSLQKWMSIPTSALCAFLTAFLCGLNLKITALSSAASLIFRFLYFRLQTLFRGKVR